MGTYKRADIEVLQLLLETMQRQFRPEKPTTVSDIRTKGMELYCLDKAAKAGEQGVMRWLERHVAEARKQAGLGS